MATNGQLGNQELVIEEESDQVSVYTEEQEVDIRSLFEEAEQLREENTKLRKVNSDEKEREQIL